MDPITSTATGVTLDLGVLEMLIPVVVPLLIRAVRRWLQNVPQWVIPLIIAPTAGAVLQLLGTLQNDSSVQPVTGAVLGLLAVALHQVGNKTWNAAKDASSNVEVRRMHGGRGNGSQRKRRLDRLSGRDTDVR